MTRRIREIITHVLALTLDFPRSFDNRRHRPTHARVRSTTQRRGKTSQPFAASKRLTICTVLRPIAFSGHAIWRIRVGENVAQHR